MIPQPEFDIPEFLKGLPSLPGVYRMYTEGDDLIYVGKAKNLKNRVRSYFQKNSNQLSPKVQVMVQQVHHLNYIVTDSEIEALILESNLIKQNKPKYNILLRDDKKFPWIGLTDDEFPRLFFTRNPDKRGKTKFFGPYTSSSDLYVTLQQVRRHFPLRQRRKPLFKNRPCMNYFIGTCLGPCQNLVKPEDYTQVVKQVELFLSGKADELLDLVHQEMLQASEALNFERAAKLRDRYQAVESVVARQKMMSDDTTMNQDIVACFSENKRCQAVVLTVRKGKLIGSRSYEIPLVQNSTEEEAYSSFIYQFYQDQSLNGLPDEVILQYPVEDEEILEAWLNQQTKKGTVKLIHPKTGVKKDMLAFAIKNAREALEISKRQHQSVSLDPSRMLLELQESLGLPDLPVRMECYDISHVQGSFTVASMVVFIDGNPDKSEYKRFKIHSAEGKPDDFKSMAEVIRRRFSHSADEGWDDPDLVIIDGGKGQLSSAVEALREQGIEEQPIISLAKKFEEVFLPGEERPILLPRTSPAFFLLQRIRDEAHRFAITYHRTLRGKAATRSILDEVKGLGPKRKQRLLEVFKTVETILTASSEALQEALKISPTQSEILHQAIQKAVSGENKKPLK